jgi:hypothetical protein
MWHKPFDFVCRLSDEEALCPWTDFFGGRINGNIALPFVFVFQFYSQEQKAQTREKHTKF